MPQLETSINVGDHAFSQMQGDLDQQRLLGERPFSDPLADIMVKEIQHQERQVFNKLLILYYITLLFLKELIFKVMQTKHILMKLK